MTDANNRNPGLSSPIGQRLVDELFRIITIEPNATGATTSAGKQLPKTRLSLQNARFAGLPAVDWNNILEFSPGDVVAVTGTINEFKGHAQLKVQSARLADDFDPASLLPTYTGDVGALEARLNAYIKAIPDERLSRVAARLLDPETDLGKKFRLAPASPAPSSHEPYLHGLLQHLLEVGETAQTLALKAAGFRQQEYGPLNMSFVMFGALLHDVAKTSAYEYGADGIKFSNAGRLNGHLVESYALIRDALMAAGDFSQQEIDAILHIIASHHGPDSDQPPRTLEAVIVHHADYFCSQLGSRFGFPH